MDQNKAGGTTGAPAVLKSTAAAGSDDIFQSQYSWMKNDEGYPEEFFDSISKSDKSAYECGICLQIVRGAVECKHHHLFCQLCIKNWLKTLSTSKFTCPVCQTASDFPVNENVNFKIAYMDVHCPCCTWTGCARDLPSHFSNCPRTNLKRKASSLTGQTAAKRMRVI